MGVVAALGRAVAPPTENSSDRRTKRRYPIHLDVQYKLLKHRRAEHLGSGRTLNISSGGVLFEADGLMPTSGPIELALNWPFLLHGSCNLKLVMRGRIVRTSNKAIAIKAEFHEFRTAGARSQEMGASQAAVRVMTA
jgi:c-di-GMP-binding flagellar brake protein YcgR